MSADNTLQSKRILIVEDDELAKEHLSILLEHLGYEVVDTCQTGKTAIRSALTFNPDLILMDIVLKGDMDGIECAEEIRRHCKIPVMYITACTDAEFFERSSLTEPFGYLVKPYNKRDLESTLRIAIHHSEMEKKLLESEKHLRNAQRIGMLGSWSWNIITNELHWSDQMFRLFGQEPQAFGANYQAFIDRVHPEDREHVQFAIDSALANKKHFCTDYRIITMDNELRTIHAEGEVSFNESDDPSMMIGTANDITSFQKAQHELWHMAYHDPLTSLPNRTLFSDRLEQAISRANRTQEKIAVMMIDLDRFKEVNDKLGHDTGDKLLLEVSDKLDKTLRGDDTLSRIGGDEFLIILNTLKTYEESIVVAKKLIASINQINHINGEAICITCSLGIAIYPEHGTTREKLIKNADTSMYRAKNQGKNTYCLFEEKSNILPLINSK